MASGFIKNLGFEELKYKEAYLFAFFILLLGFILILHIISFLKNTKNYTITEDYIKEYNFFSFSSTYYDKDDVIGFSNCKIRTRYYSYEVLTIYLCDNTKIDLKQFAYFNFSKLPIQLYARGYNYLGEENYVPKLFGREYQF